MPTDRLAPILSEQLDELERQGTRKGHEKVVTGVIPASGGKGPRYQLAGEEGRELLRMNSNSYLGMSTRPEVIEAEESASRRYGVGPGAVRFISGTYDVHQRLEERLAAFHHREAAMIMSSAYATTLGVLAPLITDRTAVISDELNHNCIINAIRLARPAEKHVYRHLDLGELEAALERAAASCRRAIVVTDGVFSMRGDHAPVDEIAEVVRRWDERFAENALLMVDDSHGVGALGATGRGTEEAVLADGAEWSPAAAVADLLVATLGKALGVNGGYVATRRVLRDHLRETAPLYIYSNPITPGESAAALRALEILDSAQGRALLDHLRTMTRRFESGLVELGYETIPGEHPVVPLMVRDTEKTTALVRHLEEHGVLATGLNYPVVPRGDQSIRFQLSADHTPADVDEVLGVLESFPDR